LHLTGRNVEQGTVELGALFVDPELLVELADTRDVSLGQRRVTLNGAGIAEEVEVGNRARRGPGSEGRRAAGGGSRCDRPARGCRHGVDVDDAVHLVGARVVRLRIIDVAVP